MDSHVIPVVCEFISCTQTKNCTTNKIKVESKIFMVGAVFMIRLDTSFVCKNYCINLHKVLDFYAGECLIFRHMYLVHNSRFRQDKSNMHTSIIIVNKLHNCVGMKFQFDFRQSFYQFWAEGSYHFTYSRFN